MAGMRSDYMEFKIRAKSRLISTAKAKKMRENKTKLTQRLQELDPRSKACEIAKASNEL